MKFDYDFFFKRVKKTKKEFFASVRTVDEAILLLDKKGIVGYDIKEIEKIIIDVAETNLKNAEPKKEPAKRRKTAPRKTRARKKARTNKKPASKLASRTEKAKDTEAKDGEEDSSYFKTWKVPYVEPE